MELPGFQGLAHQTEPGLRTDPKQRVELNAWNGTLVFRVPGALKPDTPSTPKYNPKFAHLKLKSLRPGLSCEEDSPWLQDSLIRVRD